jgi:hypothetical protein
VCVCVRVLKCVAGLADLLAGIDTNNDDDDDDSFPLYTLSLHFLPSTLHYCQRCKDEKLCKRNSEIEMWRPTREQISSPADRANSNGCIKK